MGLSRREVLMGVATTATIAVASNLKSAFAQKKDGGADASTKATKRYNLLLKGGEFIDPASGRRGQLDVAFAGDKVAAIESNIDPGLAAQVVSAADVMVVPGLIDMHVHAVHGIGSGADPDVIGVNRGVTTVLDCGTCGSKSFGVFKAVVAPYKTRVLALLGLSTIGQIDARGGEFIIGGLLIPDEAVRVAKKNPDVIVGFKARLSLYATGGAPSLPILKQLLEAGEKANLPVMVHVGDTSEKLGQILNMLRPGDI